MAAVEEVVEASAEAVEASAEAAMRRQLGLIALMLILMVVP
jgi:L-serine deaminase